MKKMLFFIFLIVLLVFGYYYFIYDKDNFNKILKETEETEFYIEHYSIFGTHLSIEGCIDEEISADLELVLKNNDEEIILDSSFYNESGKTCFYISEDNNDGIYLDELSIGNFILLVKQTNNEETSYYTVNNNTDYGDLEYYTITKNNSNNKINIEFKTSNDKNYMQYSIVESKLPDDIYDIVIDPGHGGQDVGSSSLLGSTTYYEADLTLEISLLLKEELENLGLKVKLTREDDTYLDPYGEGGRALLPNDYSGKYSLSIHLNSAEGKMNYGGVEVYIPNDINTEFATLLADNLSDVVNYSKKATDKVENGVYFTYFTESDIEQSNQDMIDKDMEPYDIVEGSPYMYMIREVGGINTYAYIDGRNDYYGLNDYYNSNQTAEPYLLELAYINYNSDLKKLVNFPEDFSNAISSAIEEYLKIS